MSSVKTSIRALTTLAGDIDPGKPLHAYDVDLLVTVELRTWLLHEVSHDVVVIIVAESSSIHAHCRYVDDDGNLT